jgi:hypothetical protein
MHDAAYENSQFRSQTTYNLLANSNVIQHVTEQVGVAITLQAFI